MLHVDKSCGGLKKAEPVGVSNHHSLRLRRLLSCGGTDQLCSRMTINKLPDEVLLGIFDFYIACPPPYEEDAWHTLVHVCRRWRYAVFGSPRRLNLRLLCMNGRLVKALDIWPELPIVIHVDDHNVCQPPSVTDVISMLKLHDRVCKIFIGDVPNLFLEEIATTSEPFPTLIELKLVSTYKADRPILPDSFLGGFVPRLRSLDLSGIPFPGIGKLLLSTRHLVTLSLEFIPRSGYISPESMVTILSGLTRLKSLYLNFPSPEFWAHKTSQPPPTFTRVVLPALTNFDFYGNSEYLEDMASRFDAPLECIAVAFEELVFDIPLLRDFIGRTQILNAPHRADTSFFDYEATISLFRRKEDVDFEVLYFETVCDPSDSQPSSFARACNLLLPTLPSLEHLGIDGSGGLPLPWQHGVGLTQWMEFLRPFITVKDLVLNEQAVLSVSSALQELVGERRVTEILPALQTIFLQGFQPSSPVPECIAKFIAARELSGHPIIVHHGEKKQ